jgi:hypothetical protein
LLGLVRSRLRAHRLLPAAAMLTVLLTTSVLASLAAFAATTGDDGLRSSLERRSASRTVITANASVTSENRESVDRSVRSALHRAFDGLPTSVEAVTRSGSFALPGSGAKTGGEASEADPDLTLFASLDRDRVRMTSGSWPAGGGRPAQGETTIRVPVAVPEAVAERLALRTGDVLRLKNRLDQRPMDAKITGVFAPKHPSDPYWRLDPLGGEGVRTSSFTTYGPLAVADAAFAEDGGLAPDETHWQADADFAGFTTGRVAALRQHVAEAVTGFDELSGVPGAEASSELPDLLGTLERSLLVNRSTLLVAGLQLAVVAGLALLLVARLLVAERTAETELLRARGGARRRIAALAAAEALLLSLPGLVLAPLVAMPVVEALADEQVLPGGGASSGSAIPAVVWWVAAGTTLACALTVALPALLAPAETALAPRRRRASTMMRGGFDIALLLIAAVALWQLASRTVGTGVLSGTGDGPGGLGIDPVLVTAPALALLAVTVPALRLLPLVVRIGERRAARWRGLTAALAGWQLSRRPARGAGPALLLVLAVAMGVFAVGQGASWDRSQLDQATFRTGADIVVRESSAPPFGQGGLFDGVEGVEAVAPVARDSFSVGSEATTEVLATDAAATPELLHLREDLAGETPASLLRPLAEAGSGASAEGIPLPEDTRELRFRLRLEATGADSEGPAGVDTDVFLTVEDRYGVPFRFAAGDLPADGRSHTQEVRLADAAGGASGSPAGPLRLTGLITTHTAPAVSVEQRLTLEELISVGPDGTGRPVVPQEKTKWSSVIRATDPAGTLGLGDRDNPEVRSLRSSPAQEDDPLLTARYATGSAKPGWGLPTVPVEMSLLPGAAEEDGEGALPAVATDAFLTATGSSVGDVVQAEIGGTDLRVRITGSLAALPTTGEDRGSDGGALLLDLASLDARLQAEGGDPLEPAYWWVAAARGESEQVAAQLRDRPSLGSVVTRHELAAELRSDPLGSGPRTALAGIAVAAAVLAATGFAVSTAGAARERRAEFAVLRALGAPRRRLAKVPAVEQGVLVLLSLVVGLGLGLLLTRLVVPLIVLTSQATTPVPALLVELPPGRLALLVGAIVTAPLLVIAATAMRSADPATTLRTERGD